MIAAFGLGDTVIFGETPGMIVGTSKAPALYLVELCPGGDVREIDGTLLKPSAAKLRRVYGNRAGGTLAWAVAQ